MIKIKKAIKKDFKEISKTYMEGFSEPPYKEKWTLKKAIKKINIFSQYCDIWKIEFKKEIIGFVIINSNQWLPGKIAFIEDIAIKKEFRKKGIASKTMNKIMKIYKDRGFEYSMAIVNKKSPAYYMWSKIGMKENKINVLINKKLK